MVKKKSKKEYEKSGFIVHPYETTGGKYHASYGSNPNKTVKRFKTLKQSKAYLKKHNIKTALYDSPNGSRNIKIVKQVKKSSTKRKPIKRKRRTRTKSMWDMSLEDLM